MDAWIAEEDDCDYLVAWVCLVAEEVHRPPGGDEGLRSAWLAVRIADALLDRHRREEPASEPGRKLAASVLTDLKFFGKNIRAKTCLWAPPSVS